MKTLVLILISVLLFVSNVYGQVLTLDSAEVLAVPTATKLDFKNVNIDIGGKTITVIYRFLSANNAPIHVVGTKSFDRTWTCTDKLPQLVENCTDVGVPYSCCTGPGAGTGCDPGNMCFTETFSFAIRAQDVGTPIGKGLRALIWSKMRPNVLTGTNNATLP